MTSITISRNGQIRSSADRRKSFTRTSLLEQIDMICEQFLDLVESDRIWNPIKNLFGSIFLYRRTEINTFRERAHKQFGNKSWWLLLRYEVERYVRGARFEIPAFHRIEKLMFALLMAALASSIVSAQATSPSLPNVNNEIPMIVAALEQEEQAERVHWLSEKPSLTGTREGVLGAHEYATTAGYSFVSSSEERASLVESGTLAELNSRYIKLIDVSEPYALPVVAQFVNRLGEQHASRGCGKLVVTSALRTTKHQGTLSNGSRNSVHPTGMSVDLRRPADEGGFCARWLKKTLLKIEASGRIDVTAENYPPHYHVVVLPNEYSEWLAKQPKGLDPEVKWLATALYFEAAFDESMEGYRAIGWAIRNRTRSEEFPNTIVEVVSEGAAGRSAGGCQFSFMCDGKAEHIQTLCTQPNILMSQFWLGKCDERWEVVVEIAKQILAESESEDLTGGAVLYYAASMPQAPYWAATDMKRSTISRFGSHRFACSTKRGDDVCDV